MTTRTQIIQIYLPNSNFSVIGTAETTTRTMKAFDTPSQRTKVTIMADRFKFEDSVFGYIVDSDHNVLGGSASLEYLSEKIVLTIMWGQSSGHIFGTWFGTNLVPAGDNLYVYDDTIAVPPLIFMVTEKTVYALVGCSFGGHVSTDFLGQKNTGKINVAYVVDAGETEDYSTVNGMQSELSYLHHWFQRTIRRVKTEVDEHNLVKGISVRYTNLQSHKIGTFEGIELQLNQSYETSYGKLGEMTVREFPCIETFSSSPSTWHSHLTIHRRVRELVSVSCLRPSCFMYHNARRLDDKQQLVADDRTLLDKKPKDWRKVSTVITGIQSYPTASIEPKHLFLYQDIGSAGIIRWVKMRDDYSDGLAPYLTVIETPTATIETHCILMGIAFEGLYTRLKSQKIIPGEAKHFRNKLEEVVTLIPYQVPFDLNAWCSDMEASYHSNKHFDRPEKKADTLTVAGSTDKAIQLMRLWIASELGLPASSVASHFQQNTICKTFTVGTMV